MRIGSSLTTTAVAALDSLHVLSDWAPLIVAKASGAPYVHQGVSCILVLATWFALPTMLSWVAFTLEAFRNFHSRINSALLTAVLKAISAARALFGTIEAHLAAVAMEEPTDR